MISVENVRVIKERMMVMDKQSFAIERGESLALIGASGRGKTTLIRVSGGLMRPSTGRVFVDEIPIIGLSERERTKIRQEKIAIGFQYPHLIPSLNGIENVVLAMRISGIKDKNIYGVATSFLERFKIRNRAHAYVTTLSGGEQRRIALARAFAMQKPYVLLDEPTTGLDDETAEEIANAIFSEHKKINSGLLFATHSMKLALRADRILDLDKGEFL